MLTKSGEYITGANVENVSFPVGTCAERVALGTAVVCHVLSPHMFLRQWDRYPISRLID